MTFKETLIVTEKKNSIIYPGHLNQEHSTLLMTILCVIACAWSMYVVCFDKWFSLQANHWVQVKSSCVSIKMFVCLFWVTFGFKCLWLNSLHHMTWMHTICIYICWTLQTLKWCSEHKGSFQIKCLYFKLKRLRILRFY